MALLSCLEHYGMKSPHMRKNFVNCAVLYKEVSILLNATPPYFIKPGKTTHLFGLSSTSPSLPPTAAVLSQLTVFLKGLRVLVASLDIQPKFSD